jgi:HSP20 family protein
MNELRQYDPFSLEPLEEGLRGLLRPWKFGTMEAVPTIKLDVSEQDTGYAVKAEIPGVRKDDIDIRVEGNRVTISAEVKSEKEDKEGGRILRRERQQGFASRSFTLGCAVDEDKVDAFYKDGVLELKLPKKAGKDTKRIAIK